MPSMTTRAALAEIENKVGPLSARHRQKLRADVAFDSFKDYVGTIDEVADVVRGWRRSDQLAQAAKRAGGIGNEAESAYRLARSSVAYEMAAADESVAAFRSKVLGGHLLEVDAIPSWVEALAKREGPATRVTKLVLPIGWRPGDSITSYEHVGSEVEVVEYPLDGWTGISPVARGGVLDQLRSLSRKLATAHGWQPAQAVAFVLADTIPIVPVLTVTTGAGSAPTTITVRASVEMSSESVAQAFSRARDESLGKRHRALPEHVWRAVSFVAIRQSRRTWRAFRAEWNRESQPAYGTDRAFAKAVRSGLGRLKVEMATDV